MGRKFTAAMLVTVGTARAFAINGGWSHLLKPESIVSYIDPALWGCPRDENFTTRSVSFKPFEGIGTLDPEIEV